MNYGGKITVSVKKVWKLFENLQLVLNEDKGRIWLTCFTLDANDGKHLQSYGYIRNWNVIPELILVEDGLWGYEARQPGLRKMAVVRKKYVLAGVVPPWPTFEKKNDEMPLLWSRSISIQHRDEGDTHNCFNAMQVIYQSLYK